MIINSPIFSGSILQANSAYANLSGSFTGAFTGSFKGLIDVQQASFDNLIVNNLLTVSGSMLLSGSATINGRFNVSGSESVTGSVNLTQGGFLVDNVNVLDTALAYAIALG